MPSAAMLFLVGQVISCTFKSRDVVNAAVTPQDWVLRSKWESGGQFQTDISYRAGICKINICFPPLFLQSFRTLRLLGHEG